MKPFGAKNSHFEWVRKMHACGDVCVLVKLNGKYRFRIQRVIVRVGKHPDGSPILWGEWITQ